MNSSVQQLARFIEAHQEFIHRMREKRDQQNEVKLFRDLLDAIDANAFSSAENWWALVVQRLEGA